MRRAALGFLAVFMAASNASAQAIPSAIGAPALSPVYPEVAALPPKQTMRVYGQNIRYYDVGKGPVVVLLHGTGDRAESWGKVIPQLARNHRVIAMDQLGFGDSDKPLIAYRIETWVNMLAEMMRAMSVSHFTLVGESLGGWIGSQYVLHSLDNPGGYPSVDKLVLTGAAGIAPKQSAGGVRSSTSAGGTSVEAIKKGLAAAYRNPRFATEEVARRRFALSLATGATYTVESFTKSLPTSDEYVDGQLARITLPTMIVWGEQDGVGIVRSKGYSAGIPGAKLAPIANCGHLPPVEQPEAFLKVVLPFIDG